ncbi:hypothetical protein [Methylocella tundrae]|uniref:hypothetical protein n=1 Tax=Methylocella tundrae TaxID=227605 RepID=UPI00106A4D20|nr:hypothetical protein SIN04_11155 [Methylocella tundrae]
MSPVTPSSSRVRANRFLPHCRGNITYGIISATAVNGWFPNCGDRALARMRAERYEHAKFYCLTFEKEERP